MTRAAVVLLAASALPGAAQSLHDLPALNIPARHAAPMGVINDTRELGTYMFGSTSIDVSHERAFVNFYSNRPYVINKMNLLHTTSDDITNRLYVIYGAAHTPSGYYGMMARAYSIGLYPDAWVKVDTETGEFVELVSYKNDASFKWEYSHDYAFNPADGLLYGLASDLEYDPTTDVARAMVGTVDLETGRFTKIKSLPEYYFCMAFDYDGVPYGVRWTYNLAVSDQPTGAMLTRFTKDFGIDKEWAIRPDGKDFEANYIHSMDFDYSTGDLYWCGMNSDIHQYLFRIDPDNGEVEKIGGIGYNDAIVGLYIPYETADHREAPARVSGLQFTACTDGSQEATLSWTNPLTQWNRQPLTELEGVEIYRDDMMSPIAVVSQGVEPGSASAYTDRDGATGLHTYYVVPVNSKGLGVLDSIHAYVGRDVPGVVDNLTTVVASSGKDVNVVWKKPLAGAHDGWYDQEGLTYNVTRMPDGKVIAEGLTKTMVKDADIEVVERYSYIVTAVSSDGEGTPLTSGEVLAGYYVPLPYSTDFENKTDANRWTPVDNNKDGKTFEYNDFDWPNVGRCYRHILSEYNNDDDLVSPPLNMEAGKTYKVSAQLNFHEIKQESVIGFKGGTDIENLTMFSTQERRNSDTRYDENDWFYAYYTAAETAPTYIALNVTTERTGDVIRVARMKVEEEFGDDLSALGFEAPLEMVADEPAAVTVEVYNNGSQTQGAYTVQLCYDRIVIGETNEVPELKSRKGAKVTFDVTPDPEMKGMQNVYARVLLGGDQNDTNDCSPVQAVDILDPGKVALNHTVTTDQTGLSSGLPMQHYNLGSLVQTIYPPSELNLPQTGDEVYIHRLGWEYTVEPNEDGTPAEVYGSQVRVALGQTTADQFSSNQPSWRGERELVAEARVQFAEGTHYLVMDLDEGFKVDPNKSLVVTVAKYNVTMAGDWMVFFSIYGEDWQAPRYWHSLKSFGSANNDIYASPNPTVVPEAPKLMLALSDEKSGVELNTVWTGGAIAWDRAARQLCLGGEGGSAAAVYDLTGRLVALGHGDGSDRMAVQLNPGLYIVRVMAADGSVRSAKISLN